MSLFSKQTVYCRACGAKMFARLAGPSNSVTCNRRCWVELNWRETLSTLGKDYYPQSMSEK